MAYDDSRLLESLEPIKYSADAIRAMNENLAARAKAAEGMADAVSGLGTNILNVGECIRDFKTDQLKRALAEASRAGMQLGSDGLPIDPTGKNVAKLMAQARERAQNVGPLWLDKSDTLDNQGRVAHGRTSGFNPDLSGMVDLDALDAYQEKLSGRRRTKAQEFRDVAKEKQLRSLDQFEFEQRKWEAKLLEQKKGLNDLQETRTQAKHELEQLELKAKTKLTNTQRNELITDIKLKKKELRQKDHELELKRKKLQSDIKFTQAQTKSKGFEDLLTQAKTVSKGVTDLETAAKTSKLDEETSYKKEQIKELKRKNEEAKLVITNRKEMEKQHATISTAVNKDAKAIADSTAKGEVADEADFFKSNEYKTFNQIFRTNLGKGRKNDIARANFAERVSNLNLPITEAQLIEAGVAITNEKGEITGYDYSPSAKKRLDGVLTRAYRDKFGRQNPPTPAILDELRKGAIAQNRGLSVGFKDAADIAAKDLDARNERAFNRVLQTGGERIDAIEAGPERTKAIAALRKELTDMPYVKGKAGLIDTAMQKFSDRDLDVTTIKFALGKFGTAEDKIKPEDPRFGKVKWDKKVMAEYGLSPIDLKSKTTKQATFETFEADVTSQFKKKHKRASDAAINQKVSRAVSRIPGYIDARLKAKLRKEANALVDAKVILGPAMIAADVTEMTRAIEQDGVIGYMDTYLKTNHGPAYKRSDEGDLKIELQNMIDQADRLYSKQIRGKDGKVKLASRAALYRAVLKMYAGSSGNSVLWWHNTTGAKGTEEGMLFDKGIDELSEDEFRSAMDPHLPNHLLSRKLTQAERVALAKAEWLRLKAE